MKLLTWLLGIVIIFILAGGAYYYFTQMRPAQAPAEPSADASANGEAPSGANTGSGAVDSAIGTPEHPATVGEKANATSVKWTFTPAGTAASGAPKTTVSITYNLGTKSFGTFEGSCTELKASSWKPLPGEVAGAICYFAGGGTEIALFQEGTVLVAKKGVLEEGSEGKGSIRGDFTVISAL